MFCETSEVYERVVKPYIDRFPKSRTQWYTVLVVFSGCAC
jgi:hypothetical protein